MLGVDPNRPVRAFRGTDPAALRAMLGAEAFERMQRMRELHRHPRPLTGQEREVVRQAAAPLLRDLAAGGLAPPHIRDEAHEDRADQAVCAWIQGAGPDRDRHLDLAERRTRRAGGRAGRAVPELGGRRAV